MRADELSAKVIFAKFFLMKAQVGLSLIFFKMNLASMGNVVKVGLEAW